MPGEENDKCQSRCYHSKYDDGIMIGAYVGYERKCGDWSCDLLFGKGLLAPENWTIPQKELHGLSVLANLKIILENALGPWVESYYAFSDSEIAVCWSIYEKVKLSTFTRNRVVNIRSKLDIDMIHHVEGKSTPQMSGPALSLSQLTVSSLALCGLLEPVG